MTSAATLYPFDPTGSLSTNKITEQQVVVAVAYNKYHTAIPKLAPYFLDSMVITLKQTDGSSRTLVKGVDWYGCFEFISASRACSAPIWGGVAFLDTSLAGVATFTYQTLGGTWAIDTTAIAELLAYSLHDPRVTAWEEVVDLPITFPVIDHEWDLVDLVGATEVVTALGAIEDAIRAANGSDFSQHLTDYSNPHKVTATQVGLGSVSNFPVASAAQAATGTSNATYMTPALTYTVVNTAQSTLQAEINAHLADHGNPHDVTATQVGLGNVQNYPIATSAQATAGSSNAAYMTPALTYQAITAQSSSLQTEIDSHIDDITNPHRTTATQVGLGSVQNFPIATSDQALAGTSNAAYMTPALTSQVIAAQNTNLQAEINAHLADHGNPHAVTATQVGLGNVQNYPVATADQALAGTSNATYMTPALVYSVLNGQGGASAGLGAHEADHNNPHVVTAEQVGAYTTAEVDLLFSTKLATKLDVNGTALSAENTAGFNGMDSNTYKAFVLEGKAADTASISGMTPAAYATWVLTQNGPAANADTLTGQTVDQIVTSAVSAVGSQQAYAPRSLSSTNSAETAGSYWTELGSFGIPAAGSDASTIAAYQDGIWSVAGGESGTETQSAVWLLRIGVRGSSAAPVTLEVVNLTGSADVAAFGYTVETVGTGSVARIWVKTQEDSNQISTTVLLPGAGSAENATHTNTEPTGITYVTSDAFARMSDLSLVMTTVTAAFSTITSALAS